MKNVPFVLLLKKSVLVPSKCQLIENTIQYVNILEYRYILSPSNFQSVHFFSFFLMLLLFTSTLYTKNDDIILKLQECQLKAESYWQSIWCCQI